MLCALFCEPDLTVLNIRNFCITSANFALPRMQYGRIRRQDVQKTLQLLSNET